MRKFFYVLIRNLLVLYACAFVVLVYRISYNEIYNEIHVSSNEKVQIYPCGKIVGLYTKSQGVFVIDICEIENQNGEFIAPAKGVLEKGDYVLAINGETIYEKEELIEQVSNSKGSPLKMLVLRDGVKTEATIQPVLAKNGEYMLGVWVKDDLAGIGTITYFTEEGDFAALGHGMGDGETNELLELESGEVFLSSIIGIEKGKQGDPGEVKSVIYYGVTNHIGKVDINNERGIYGTLDREDLTKYANDGQLCEVGYKENIDIGPAQIISEVSGELRVYDIQVTYVDYLATNSNKGLHIKVTDPELLRITGGIVQGMSGSPIIQNGKLIGAITHVLINDPTKGYGIFIENMLDAAG